MDQVIEGVIKIMQLIFFFLMWTIFKVFIEFVTVVLLFHVFVLFCFVLFACKACGILALRPRIELTAPLLEGEVLTTGPPGKSHATDS